jgi:YVTN family beta-propeller protein
MAELSPGAILAGYRIEAQAGRGGMGVVYRATQLSLGRPVALKLIAGELAQDRGFRERFKRESQVAAVIDHPNVIPVFEAGEADGQLFITMRYVDGTDLRAIIVRDGCVEPARAGRIVRQVAAGLDAAHARGLVHRDVKPANILITHDAEDHVYLTDFGLTKQLADSGGLTKTGQFVGSLDYVAPEQIEGRTIDARADVYALGCVLFHAVTGAVPYVRDSEVAKMWAHMNDPPPVATEVRDNIPRALDGVIQRSMAKDPVQRFPSAGDLGRAVESAVEGRPHRMPEVSVAKGMAAPTSRPDPATVPAAGSPTVPAAEETTTGPAPSAREGGATAPAATEAIRPPSGSPPRGAAPPAPGARRRNRARLAVIGALVAGLALIALAVAGLFGGGNRGKPGAGAGGAAAMPAVAATIDVGKGPDGLAVDDQGSVWVVLDRDNRLVQIGPSNRVLARVPTGRAPNSVTVGKGVVWETNQNDDTAGRFEVRGRPVAGGKIPVGRSPHGIALGKQLVWVVNRDDNTVTRIDRASPAVVGAPIGVGLHPRGVFIGDQDVWVTNYGDNTVTRIDSSSSAVLDPAIRVGVAPRGVVEGLGSVWVANSGNGTVTRIDAKTAKPVGRAIQVGSAPYGVAVGAGSVWVTNSGSNSVSRIDPSTGRVVGQPIAVGTQPHGVAVGGGAVWVANSGDGTVTRIKP